MKSKMAAKNWVLLCKKLHTMQKWKLLHKNHDGQNQCGASVNFCFVMTKNYWLFHIFETVNLLRLEEIAGFSRRWKRSTSCVASGSHVNGCYASIYLLLYITILLFSSTFFIELGKITFNAYEYGIQKTALKDDKFHHLTSKEGLAAAQGMSCFENLFLP